MAKPGLYSNIAAKKKRIAAGSGEKMRKVGTKGAPTAANFKRAAKTAKRTQHYVGAGLDAVDFGATRRSLSVGCVRQQCRVREKQKSCGDYGDP